MGDTLILTKRKTFHDGVVVAGVVYHEISKFRGKALVINHIHSGRSKVKPIMHTVNVFQGQCVVF